MAIKTPSVSAGFLSDPLLTGSTIRLDSPAWVTWLEAATTTRFAYPLCDPAVGYSVGVMTVRKEGRQRGGVSWSGYRRAGHRLRTVYLGRSPVVTAPQLEAAAQVLREEDRQRH